MSEASPTGGDTTPTTATTDSPAATNDDQTTAAQTTVTEQPDPTTVTTTQAQPTTTQQQETTSPTTTATPASTTTTQNTQLTTTTAPDNDPTTTSNPQTTSQSANSSTTIVITGAEGQTSTVVVTQTTTGTGRAETTSSLPASSSTGVPASGSGSSTSGLSTGGKIAVAVVVPIAAVALLFIVGLFFWRKRRARKDEEEQRKEDLKNYTFNPNDPTIPPIGGAVGGDAYEMKEDTSTGYRGWGTSTLASSVGRKASTTMSGGGAAGQPYSDMTNLIQPHHSDSRPGEPIRSDGTVSPEGEILGAMGPPASQNRGGGDIRRGPSNASSHYSMGAGSEDSEGRGIGIAYGGPAYPPQQQQPPTGYEQYGTANPYSENPYAFAPAPPPGARTAPGPNTAELGGQPVIRDNPSRRTTQIQNSPYVPQPGISQNF